MKRKRRFPRIYSSQRFFVGALLVFSAAAAIWPHACAQATATVAAPPNHSRAGYGFNLLSAVIEKACAEDFLSCMHDLVFSPLGLRFTVADQPSELIEQRARFYTHWKDKPLENSPYTDNSYKWAGGGFLSTSEDLVRFGNALLEPGYLKKEPLGLLFTSQKTKSGEETGYGMGWAIEKSKSGKRIFDHSGGSTGASSELIIYPDEHLVIAMVCNYETDSNGWKFEEAQ